MTAPVAGRLHLSAGSSLQWCMRRLVLAVPLGIIGIGLLAWVPFAVYMNRASASWKVASGKITSATIDRRSIEGGQGGLLAKYFPAVEYTYEAGGRSHTGHVISFASGKVEFGDEASAQAYLRSFSNQRPLEVYVDPKDADRSCLIPGGDLDWTLLGAALFFGLLSIAAAWIVSRREGGKERAAMAEKLAAAQALLDAKKGSG